MNSLAVYRNLIKDRVIGKLYELLDYLNKEEKELQKAISLYSDFYFRLTGISTYSLKEYIIQSILSDENQFSFGVQSLKP
jgi:hypothetical protein